MENGELKQRIVGRLKQVGAFDVRIAVPEFGFEHALPGGRPRELWPDCNAIIVFGVAMPPAANNTFAGPYSHHTGERNLGPVPAEARSPEHAMDRMARLFLHAITLRGIALLSRAGQAFSFILPQSKLCAQAAGLGVYGKSGLILHPVLGNRMAIGTIMTDAKLEPDPPLMDFKPCENCDRCIRLCPAGAYDPDKAYPDAWSVEKCLEKRGEIEKQGFYCHLCFSVCRASRIPDDKLLAFTKVNPLLH